MPEDAERKAFYVWLKETDQEWRMMMYRPEDYRSSAVYTEWKQAGRPGYTPTGVPAIPRPQTRLPAGYDPWFAGERGDIPRTPEDIQRAIRQLTITKEGEEAPEEPEQYNPLADPNIQELIPGMLLYNAGTDRWYSAQTGNEIPSREALQMYDQYYGVDEVGGLTAGEQLRGEQWEQEFEYRQRQDERRDRLAREELLASMSGPRDWIKYWMATAGSPPEIGIMQRGTVFLQRQIEQARNEIAEFEKNTAGIPSGVDIQMPEGLAERIDLLPQWEQRLAELTEATGWYQAQGPRTPPAPDWLVEHVPGLRTGQPIRALQARTPSPQMWEQMAPGEQQGLLGYYDWAASENVGRTGASMLSHMEQMLPRTTPRTGRTRPRVQRS